MIGLAYIDATFTDIAGAAGHISVRKYSPPFFVEIGAVTNVLHGLADGVAWAEGNHMEAFSKGSDVRRKASPEVFSVRFIPVQLQGAASQNVYCLKQPSLLAIEMKHPFGVHVLTTDDAGSQDFEHKLGEKGDYLIQTISGGNDIVKHSDLNVLYQTTNLDKVELPLGVEALVRQAVRRAQDRSQGHSLAY